jgi:hypothetical protein
MGIAVRYSMIQRSIAFPISSVVRFFALRAKNEQQKKIKYRCDELSQTRAQAQ